MMRLILMFLLLTICQSPPIFKNVLSIYEMTILLVPLSSKAFLINIQDLIYSLNNKYFQNHVQIFKPYWKIVNWHVTCILGAKEHKIISRGSISTTKCHVFQVHFPLHNLCFFFCDYLLIFRFWIVGIVVLLPYPLHFMVHN
jgi:hypothetical protein